LSGFLPSSAVKERHQHDFVVKTKNGKQKTIRVPILEIDNLVADMAIDAKQIGGDFYTVLTNRKSGKIALLAQTVKATNFPNSSPNLVCVDFMLKV